VERGEAEPSEEGYQLEAQPNAVSFDPLSAPLPLGNNLVFFEELVGSFGEALFRLEDARTGLAAKP